MVKFTINNFYEHLHFGREIEFLFCGDMFFIQPDYKFMKRNGSNQDINNMRFVLYKCANWNDNDAETILSGTYDEIISFTLKDNMSIKTDFNKFQLNCIL